MDTNQNKQSYALPDCNDVCTLFYDCLRYRFTKSDGSNCKNQFQASNLLSQLGNFANFLAYAFMGIPAGLMLQKLVIKKLLLLQFW